MQTITLLKETSAVTPRSLLAHAVLAGIRNTHDRPYFDMCPVSNHLAQHATKEEAEFLRALHCVKWELIEKELAVEIVRVLTKIVNSL